VTPFINTKYSDVDSEILPLWTACRHCIFRQKI